MSGERITDHLSVVLSPFLLSFLPPCSPVVQSSYFSPPILKRSPAEKFSRYAG